MDEISCNTRPTESEKQIARCFRRNVLDVVLDKVWREYDASLRSVSTHSVTAVEAAPPWVRDNEFPPLGSLDGELL
ncbi:hypothetical protein AHiyo8_03050 [Arthrobacter sp. Hiyo8]|nr:hypothetical protein AHiyo8_03050 [Arthrobacter sp. Hiyo8]